MDYDVTFRPAALVLRQSIYSSGHQPTERSKKPTLLGGLILVSLHVPSPQTAQWSFPEWLLDPSIVLLAVPRLRGQHSKRHRILATSPQLFDFHLGWLWVAYPVHSKQQKLQQEEEEEEDKKTKWNVRDKNITNIGLRNQWQSGRSSALLAGVNGGVPTMNRLRSGPFWNFGAIF